MYGNVKDGKLVKTNVSLQVMFPNVVIPHRATPEFTAWKAANGVVEVIYGSRKDERFYFNTENTPVLEGGQVTINYTGKPKLLNDRAEVKKDGTPLMIQVYNAETEQMEDTDVQVVTKGLKSQWTAQIKDTAGKLLAQTDWMVIRKAERDVAIPADVVAKRAAIVAECTRLEAAIASAADVDALKAVIDGQNWA